MFWKSSRYEEEEKMIYSTIQKRDENDKKIDVEIKFNVGDLRRFLDLGDSNDDPTIIPERLCKGLYCRIGFEGNVNGKSMFSRPYKFLIHCIIHALSHRKGAYDESSDYIMNTITCLVLNRPYNISQVLLDHLIENIRDEKYIMYLRFMQMMINDQVADIPKDPADVMTYRNMTGDTLKRLSQYKLKKEEKEPRAKHSICKIENPGYVAPENDAWRHNNSNSEDETDRLRDMYEKKLRDWFVRDRKRKRTPKTSPAVSAPKVPTPKIVVKGPSKKSPTRLVDEPMLEPSDVLQQATTTQHEGDVQSDSGDADDEATETEPEIDMAKVGHGKVQLKKKPQKKRKGSDEEDSTYLPTAKEKKKLRTKRKAVQSGVIPRNVRAKKAGATMPESQSGKSEKHIATSKGPETEIDQNVEVPNVPEVQSVEKPEVVKEKAPESPEHVKKGADDAESSRPKKTVLPDPFEGFPNIRGELKGYILLDDEFDMFHDASVKDLKKKMSFLEKEKEKAEAERDELKQQLEELAKVNEEIKSVIIKHAKKIKNMEGDVDDNAKLFEQLSLEITDLHLKNTKLNEINQTLNQLLSELHEASANEFKAMKLEMEALRADKSMKDEQLHMLYDVMEHHLGIDI
ncbi:hypothetical protein Hdeb2414_s0771g00945361 [Helianthus debilis subsp. tardiflorus]